MQVASVDFYRTLSVSAGESRWVSLPCGAELQQQFVTENSAVRISSSSAISVVSFNRRFATGDGSVVSPAAELGTDYFVFTPTVGMRNMDKLMAVVNGHSHNRITILPQANVHLRGGTGWQRGKAVTISLAPYASYLVRSHSTLTGTRVRSQHPVAILAGHQCLSLGGRCEHIYEQLPPVSSFGTEYMVPRVGAFQTKSWAVIAAPEENTELKLHRGHSATKQLSTMSFMISDKYTHDTATIKCFCLMSTGSCQQPGASRGRNCSKIPWLSGATRK